MTTKIRTIAFAPGVTVSQKDAVALWIDMDLYGNGYIKPSGVEDPSHVRIAPPEDEE